jgi:hypothetical protein
VNIRTAVRQALKARYGHVSFHFPDEGHVIAVVQAPNPALHQLEIHDRGGEVAVYVGFVPGFFGAPEESEERIGDVLASELCSFLDSLFADRVVVWRGALACGWDEVPSGAPVEAHGSAESHVWSRPLRRPSSN